MTDPATDPRPTQDGGLARRVAVAGLQVSQAAAELAEAADRLTAAEEAVREAEDRWRTVDQELAQRAAKNAELVEMLRRTRAAKDEADERASRAEERAQAMMERAREQERQTQELEARARGHEARARELEEHARTQQDRVRELEAGARGREGHARELEEHAGVLQERVRDLEARVAEAEARVEEARAQVVEAEARVAEAEAPPQVTLVVDDERTALQEAVAADVRRPLTSILGLTLAFKHADPHSPEGADMVRQLAANARKLDRLVGEMLAIDQIASGAFAPNRRRTDLEALVRRVVDESVDVAGHDVRVEAEHVAIEVDPALAEQMVESLLANAGRRSTPGAPVVVKISSDQGGAVIAVDDTGPEVPAGLRGTTLAAGSDEGPAARQRSRGATGLTLLTRLAEIHGGRAWVEERPGGGASFRVFLPTTQEPKAEPHDGSADDRAAAQEPEADGERATRFARALAEADREERAARLDAVVAANGHRSAAEDADELTS